MLTPLDERVIGMPPEQLHKVTRSVGIAGGQRKQAAIRGALRSRWINVLITDRWTAEALAQAGLGSSPGCLRSLVAPLET